MATSAVASEILGNLLPMGKGTMKSKHEMETFDLLKAARAARKNKSEMRVLRFSKNLLEMKSRKVEELQKGIEQSKSTIANLREKVQKKEGEIVQLKGDLGRERKDRDRIKNRLENLQVRSKKQKEDLSRMLRERDVKIANMSKDLAEKNLELILRKKDLKNARRERDDKQKKMIVAQEAIAKLKGEKASESRKKKTLLAQLNRIRIKERQEAAQLAKIKGEYGELQKSSKALKAKYEKNLRAAKADSDEKEKVLERTLERLENVEKQKEEQANRMSLEKENALESLRINLTDKLDRAHKDYKEAISREKELIEKFKKETEDHKNKLDEAVRIKENEIKKSIQLKEEIKALNKRVDTEATAYAAQLDGAQRDYDKELLEMKKNRLEAHEKELKELKRKLFESERKNASLAKAAGQLAEVKEKIEKQKKELKRITKEKAKEEEEKKKITDTLEKYKRRLRQLESYTPKKGEKIEYITFLKNMENNISKIQAIVENSKLSPEDKEEIKKSIGNLIKIKAKIYKSFSTAVERIRELEKQKRKNLAHAQQIRLYRKSINQLEKDIKVEDLEFKQEDRAMKSELQGELMSLLRAWSFKNKRDVRSFLDSKKNLFSQDRDNLFTEFISSNSSQEIEYLCEEKCKEYFNEQYEKKSQVVTNNDWTGPDIEMQRQKLKKQIDEGKAELKGVYRGQGVDDEMATRIKNYVLGSGSINWNEFFWKAVEKKNIKKLEIRSFLNAKETLTPRELNVLYWEFFTKNKDCYESCKTYFKKYLQEDWKYWRKSQIREIEKSGGRTYYQWFYGLLPNMWNRGRSGR